MEPRWVIHLFGVDVADIVPISVGLTLLLALFGYLISRRLRIEDPRGSANRC